MCFIYSRCAFITLLVGVAMAILSFFGGCSHHVALPESSLPKPPNTYELTDYRSLLWEISGKGLRRPSYLFGTIHLIPKNQFKLSDNALKALNVADRLTLEIDMDDPTLLFSAFKSMMMSGNKTLRDFMPEEDYKLITDYFRTKGIPLDMVKRMKPILLSSMLTESGVKEEMVTYENELMNIVKKQKKKVYGLETAAYQMRVLDSIPYDKQAKMLVDAIRKTNDPTQKDEVDEYAQMLKLYADQDIGGMYTFVSTSSGDMQQYERSLLSTRNHNWIPVMAKMMPRNATFFAVGAGHLGGQNGLISLLRKEGYEVKPLR